MNFEQWWNTLTIKEQSMIGKNNAKYVWDSACEMCSGRIWKALVAKGVDWSVRQTVSDAIQKTKK